MDSPRADANLLMYEYLEKRDRVMGGFQKSKLRKRQSIDQTGQFLLSIIYEQLASLHVKAQTLFSTLSHFLDIPPKPR